MLVKNFLSKIIIYFFKIWVKKNFGGKKMFGQKKFLVKKSFWSKKFSSQKNFGVINFFGYDIAYCQLRRRLVSYVDVWSYFRFLWRNLKMAEEQMNVYPSQVTDLLKIFLAAKSCGRDAVLVLETRNGTLSTKYRSWEKEAGAPAAEEAET